MVQKDYRRGGVASALALSAVSFARDHGARAIDGYPRLTADGEEMGDLALYVGSQDLRPLRGIARSATRRRVAP